MSESSAKRELYINEMIDLVVETYKIDPKQNLAFRGTPGIGKTEAFEEITERLKKIYPDFFVKVVIGSQMEGVDIRIPWVAGEKYRFLPNEMFVFDKDAHGILFMDEAANMQPDVFKAIQQMLSDRKLGEIVIPDGVMICCAMNNKADRAGANSIPTAFANRLEWHQIGVDYEAWLDWAERKGLRIELRSFIKKFPNTLNQFKPDRDVNATPRSWAKVNKVLDSKYMYDRVAGLVGEELATQFKAWTTMFEQFPEPEDIEKDPEKCKRPEKADAQYAIALALADWVKPSNWSKFFIYIQRFNLEYQILYIKEATRLHPKAHFKDTAEYSNWIVKHQDKIL